MSEKVTAGLLHVLNESGKIVNTFHTIELPWKNNEPLVSCIPEGTYDMEFKHSPFFKVNLWRLLKVPNRQGILIHSGNYTRQIKGCILVGDSHTDLDNDGILDVANSKKTLSKLHYNLINQKTCTIKIVNYA